MKWLMTTIMLVALFSSTAIAVMGPPMADLKQGQFEYGFGFSEFKLDDFDTTGKLTLSGQVEFTETMTYQGGMTKYGLYVPDSEETTTEITTLPTETTKFKFKSKGFNTTSYLGRMGIGVTKDLSVDIYLGGSELDPSGDLKHDTGYAGGFGLRMNLYQKDKLTIGASARWIGAQWQADFDLDAEPPLNVYCAEWDMRYDELKFLVGPTYRLTNQCVVYGGPCYNVMRGDYTAWVDVSNTITDDRTEDGYGLCTSETRTVSMREDSRLSIEDVGVIVGMQFHLSKALMMGLEAEFANDADCLGINIVYRF